jgi:hypothetical protein
VLKEWLCSNERTRLLMLLFIVTVELYSTDRSVKAVNLRFVFFNSLAPSYERYCKYIV